jgi:hypothetical protein
MMKIVHRIVRPIVHPIYDFMSAEDLRKYFFRILHHGYDIPLEEAQQLSKRWHYGKGSDARKFNVQCYREIFGPEVGTLLYQYNRDIQWAFVFSK